MIKGIGIDILEISRVDEKLTKRIFSEEEMKLWQKRQTKEFLAGRFALKEAFFKALGTGIRDIELSDLSFVSDDLGAIHLFENEVVDTLKEKYDFDFVHASLSHDNGMVVAVVVIENRKK
ncbi:MAG: holo-ACP synthase [Thermotogae bacterium]|jgi:holo-[acyl-carrier-protein] synthase|nr:holo-ACP synthase [Thermotogota bacterium]MCL5032040.1 holo-ACP synthase [Thermotogota bacterium]